MTEPIFFEIPIYRCSLDSHTDEMKAQESNINMMVPKETSPESNQAMLDNFHNSIWYAWKYNEIVGYLNLFIFGTQFRVDIWFINKRRINKGIVKKRFIYSGKAMEKAISSKKPSIEIFHFVIEQLENLNKRDYRKYTFDLTTFKTVGVFIDWVHLVDKLNSFKYPVSRV